MTSHGQSSTGVHDLYYDLASVMYHALNGAQTYEQYARDAEQTGDNELAQFFRQAQQQDSQCAQMAMQLLVARGARMTSAYQTGAQTGGTYPQSPSPGQTH